jgi:hypothetical protein
VLGVSENVGRCGVDTATVSAAACGYHVDERAGLAVDESRTTLHAKSCASLTIESSVTTRVKGNALLQLDGGAVLVNGTPIP